MKITLNQRQKHVLHRAEQKTSLWAPSVSPCTGSSSIDCIYEHFPVVQQQTVSGQTEPDLPLSWKPFRAADTKGRETRQPRSHNYPLYFALISSCDMSPLTFSERTKRFGATRESHCLQTESANLSISFSIRTMNNKKPICEVPIRGTRSVKVTDNGFPLFGTHQLHIVESFVSILFQCCLGILVQREDHSLQSCLLGVHVDVCLHLNTTKYQQHFSSSFWSLKCTALNKKNSRDLADQPMVLQFR